MSFELNESNLFIFAAKHYYNPLGADHEEFIEDLKRFQYVKRLINRYLESDKLSERLILNHLIVIFNVFGPDASLQILNMKMKNKHWAVLKPFLIFLQYLKSTDMSNIPLDPTVVKCLRKIGENK